MLSFPHTTIKPSLKARIITLLQFLKAEVSLGQLTGLTFTFVG